MDNKQEIEQKKDLSNEIEELQRLMDLAECGMLIVGMLAEPKILYANDYFYRCLQYTREEYEEQYGDQALATMVPEEKQKIKALIARQSAAGGVIHLEFRARRKDGSMVWIGFAGKREMEDYHFVYRCSCQDITISKLHLEDAYKAKKDLDLIANNIPGGVIKLRMSDMHLLYANDGFFRLSGYSRAEYSINFKNCCSELVYVEDAEYVSKAIKSAVANRGNLGLEYRIQSKRGEIRWSYVNGTPIDSDHGETVYLCVVVDITSRKKAEAQLADNNHRYEMLTRMLRETTWTYDIEESILRRSGDLGVTYSPESVLEGSFSDEKLHQFVHPEDIDRFIQVRDAWIHSIGEHRDMFRILNDRGVYEPVEVCAISEGSTGTRPDRIYGITRFVDEASQPMAMEQQVIHPDDRLEGKIYRMAKSAQATAEDSITGLLPYVAFLKKAESMLSLRSEDDKYALVCADINEFRKFSHHYGFSISNQILKVFSGVLLDNLAKDGMCTRVDGDYFVVLFQYTNHKDLLNSMSAVLRRQEDIQKQADMEDYMKFGSTVGIYLVQKEDHELLQMLEKADLARRSIKGLAGNHYSIYTDDISESMLHEEEQIVTIRQAMQNHTVEICYLPRIQGDREHIVGCKALPHIQMEDGQYLDSQKLMHMTERGGRLEEFSFFVLGEVAQNLGAWKLRGNEVIPVSIEMTSSQLSTANAVSKIDTIVRQNGLLPKDFLFEVPERYFADSTSSFDMAIKELSNLGYQVIISRFGADHTAIHTIRHLPVAGIKFHGEYFSQHMIESRETVIMSTIVSMTKELGMTVYCGGIQTKMQEDYARKIGCDLFEGDVYFGAMRGNVFEKCFLS